MKKFLMYEGYLNGNETMLENGKYDYLNKQQTYFNAMLASDTELIAKLDKQRIEKEKEYMDKYNMTIQEFLDASTKKLEKKKMN